MVLTPQRSRHHGIAGGIALKQNHETRTRPVVLRAPASAAYGLKNDPLVYLGLWGIGAVLRYLQICSMKECILNELLPGAGICTSAAVGSLYGFMRMVRRFGKWSTRQTTEWVPHFAPARALVRSTHHLACPIGNVECLPLCCQLGRRTMVRTGLGTAGLLTSVFIADRVMDRVFLAPYVEEAQRSLFTLKNMPDPATVDAYIAATHTSYFIISTLLLSFTPYIVLPSLIATVFVSAANYKVYMLATQQRNRRRILPQHQLAPSRAVRPDDKE